MIVFIGNPLSLLRTARVSLRRALGPSNLDEGHLQSLKLNAELQTYVQSIRNDCCSSNEAKRHALQGRTVNTGSNFPATTKF